MDELEKFMNQHAGVATVTELAAFYDAPETKVRQWARTHGVRRAGSVFAFDFAAAEALGEDLVAAEEPDEEEESDEEDAEDDEFEEDQ